MFVALVLGFLLLIHVTQEEGAGYSAEEGAFVEEAMAIHGNELGCVEF